MHGIGSGKRPNRTLALRATLLVLAGLMALPPVPAQVGGGQPLGHEQDVINPVPPPLPRREPPEDSEELGETYAKAAPESDKPWVIEKELLGRLQEVAGTYGEFATNFTCEETSREATYKRDGKVSERSRVFDYILVLDSARHSVREIRQITKGRRAETVDDVEDRFPPAYAWVFLFSRFNESFFSYRYMGDRFDGYDWIHEVQFRGSLPFAGGKDIREWEGTVLIDAVTHTPLKVIAEPNGQQEMIAQRYREYAASWNIIGIRTKPKPTGFKADVSFREKAGELSFPSSVRYDIFEAVSTSRVTATAASLRSYENYRFFKVDTREELGEGS